LVSAAQEGEESVELVSSEQIVIEESNLVEIIIIAPSIFFTIRVEAIFISVTA
jgi:hypothetical protein